MLEALKKFGLSEKESKVYLACLELDEALASEISSKTEISRTLVYDILERLIDLGLISYNIKNNKKLFKAVAPEQLLTILKEKEEAINNIMPKLKKIQTSKGFKKAKIDVYEGKEGMKTIMNDILRSNEKEFLSYGSSKSSFIVMPYFMLHWHKERIKKRMIMKIIYNDTEDARKRLKKYIETLKLAEYKFMPIKLESPNATLIYNNKVALTVWVKEPYAILIESKEISDNYREYFNALWKIAK